jgi:O-antigen ligase
MLRLLFAVLIFYVVYSLHYPLETGITALNVSNLLFAAVVVAILARPELPGAPATASLKGPLLLFFATLVVSFLIARADGKVAFIDDLTILKNALFYPLFYFLALRCRLDLRQTRQMIILVLVVACIAGVQAIRQGLDYGLGNFVETHRASGPFGTSFAMANRAGVYYAMYVPVFAAVALAFRGQRLWRLAGIVGLLLMILAIMFTYSRQSYGIALAGLALVFLRRSLVASVVLALVLVVAVGYLPSSVTERVEETQQRTTSGAIEVDPSTASRWEIWDGAMDMWEEHPMGVGLNRFWRHIGHYAPAYEGYDAHNYFVLTLCEGGVLGLATLLWLMWGLSRHARRLRRAAPPGDAEAEGLALGFGAFVVCMALGNLYGSPFSEGAVMGNFWVLCGLLERYMALRNGGAAEQVAEDPELALRGRMIERFPLAARAAGIRAPQAPARIGVEKTARLPRM